MTLRTVLPFGDKDSVKNLVFSILTKEYPLKLIDLTNYIRKRYGKSVTFQAVRKATLSLVDDEVLVRDRNEFSINRDWVAEAKATLEKLHADLQQKRTPAQVDSVGGDVTVFTFSSVAKMMRFWQDIVDEWYRKFKPNDLKINCYQGAHYWEALLYPDTERKVWEQLKKKGITSYTLSTGNTPLDRSTDRFYRSVGLHTRIVPAQSTFDHTYYVGTYGQLVLQTQYPKDIAKDIEKFFRKNKRIEDLDLRELSAIVHRACTVKLTVIKNFAMAQQINKSIMDQF
jgi:hypothetical protein